MAITIWHVPFYAPRVWLVKGHQGTMYLVPNELDAWRKGRQLRYEGVPPTSSPIGPAQTTAVAGFLGLPGCEKPTKAEEVSACAELACEQAVLAWESEKAGQVVTR